MGGPEVDGPAWAAADPEACSMADCDPRRFRGLVTAAAVDIEIRGAAAPKVEGPDDDG